MMYPLLWIIPLHRKRVWYLTVQCTTARLDIKDLRVSVGKILTGSLCVSSWMLFSRVNVTSSGGTTQQLSRLTWIASGLILAALWRSMKAWGSISLTPSVETNCWSKRASIAPHKSLPFSGATPAGQDKMKRSADFAPSSSRARKRSLDVIFEVSFHGAFVYIYLHLIHPLWMLNWVLKWIALLLLFVNYVLLGSAKVIYLSKSGNFEFQLVIID